MALILSLRALQQARDTAEVAWELRRAQVLLAHLLDTAPWRYAASSGESDEFTWAVETSPIGAERPIEVCRRAASIENVRTGRAFRAVSLETCPLEGAS